MPGSLDLTYQTRRKLDSIGASSNFFAELTGYPKSQIATHLNGSKPLSNEKAVTLYETAKLLEKMVEMLKPFTLSLHPTLADQIRGQLQQIKQGSLTVRVHDSSAPPTPRSILAGGTGTFSQPTFPSALAVGLPKAELAKLKAADSAATKEVQGEQNGTRTDVHGSSGSGQNEPNHS